LQIKDELPGVGWTQGWEIDPEAARDSRDMPAVVRPAGPRTRRGFRRVRIPDAVLPLLAARKADRAVDGHRPVEVHVDQDEIGHVLRRGTGRQEEYGEHRKDSSDGPHGAPPPSERWIGR